MDFKDFDRIYQAVKVQSKLKTKEIALMMGYTSDSSLIGVIRSARKRNSCPLTAYRALCTIIHLLNLDIDIIPIEDINTRWKKNKKILVYLDGFKIDEVLTGDIDKAKRVAARRYENNWISVDDFDFKLV